MDQGKQFLTEMILSILESGNRQSELNLIECKQLSTVFSI